ncbi:ATP-binding protein [Microcoleus sp. FACHB-1515]|uniref:ATP-binding protein n=1 Tax=Cyanophyceae TaxID=3028117 RepID=UPI001686B4FF|nr:ATP-binding protein [Microcoleus sp. FACHB-1515]MBD2092262.1 ATP-binding protein [Microcoleus sp. FACHB-1515]
MAQLDSNSQLLHESHLQVETDIHQIPHLLQWFAQFNQPPLSEQLWLQGQIALVEGFTNAARHAHQHLPRQTPIDLEVKVFRDRLVIAIWDEGAAFDLEALMEQTELRLADPLQQAEHWGGVLMQKLKDQYGWQIAYLCPERHSGDRNCLLMQKAFTSSR